MAGFDNDVVYANNADFSTAGAAGGLASNGLQLNGQLWIGTTAVNAGGTHINVGRITSADGSITVANGAGTIDIAVTGAHGPTIESLTVDANTGPGTNPVVPNGSGNVTITGGQVAAGVVAGGKVIRTDSLAANTYTIEIQRSQAVQSSTLADNGVSHFASPSFAVDSNGFVSSLGNNLNGSVVNIGINYSSPTFKVTSANGTALSSSNPGYVLLQSNTSAGYNKAIAFTADISFQDATGTSDIVNNLFGTTSGRAWGSSTPMPFYLYAVTDSTNSTVTFMISRVPSLYTSPAAGNIGKSGSAVASTQGSFFAIDSTITVANYATKPCVMVGSFLMSKSAGDDWTVTALAKSDGIGLFQDGVNFLMPAGQNGANSGSYFSSSVGGDTMPIFNQTGYNYRVNRDGTFSVAFTWDSITNTGIGAGNLRFHMPMSLGYLNLTATFPGSMSFLNNGAANYNTYFVGVNIGGTALSYMNMYLAGAGTALLTPAGLTTDKQQGGITVRAWINNG